MCKGVPLVRGSVEVGESECNSFCKCRGDDVGVIIVLSCIVLSPGVCGDG